MKALDQITYEGKTLTVLIHEKEIGKGYISYFIDGNEIEDWGKMKPIYQTFFTSISDHLCKVYNLTKWSY